MKWLNRHFWERWNGSAAKAVKEMLVVPVSLVTEHIENAARNQRRRPH